MVLDLAGNRYKTARNAGALNAQPKVFQDGINLRDRLDFYRFRLARRSTFHVSLSKLTADADLELSSSTGKVLARSSQTGTNSEACLKTLNAGVYYLKVSQRNGNTQYRLSLSASNAAQLPIPNGSGLTGDRWLYQLQNTSVPAINATDFNLLTIDYSRDGSDAQRYTPAALQSLHNNGKNVLSYLSIGEAEDYRYYFRQSWVADDPSSGLKQPIPNKAPAWLDRTNPDWEGNYKVQYWSQNWQNVVLNYLDRIIDAGFDGVYLDIVDGFEYWSNQSELNAAGSKNKAITETKAAQQMIQFVERIAYHARVMRGKANFQIVPQNAESILAYDQDGSYLKTINGIGIEDLFYDTLTPLPAAVTQSRLQWLNRVQAAGKTVLVVDYVDDGTGNSGENGTRINDFLNQANSRAYRPYVGVSDRELNTINTFPSTNP